MSEDDGSRPTGSWNIFDTFTCFQIFLLSTAALTSMHKNLALKYAFDAFWIFSYWISLILFCTV